LLSVEISKRSITSPKGSLLGQVAAAPELIKHQKSSANSAKSSKSLYSYGNQWGQWNHLVAAPSQPVELGETRAEEVVGRGKTLKGL